MFQYLYFSLYFIKLAFLLILIVYLHRCLKDFICHAEFLAEDLHFLIKFATIFSYFLHLLLAKQYPSLVQV